MAHRPLVRWVVPAGVLAAVLGGGAVATTLTASAQSSLPSRSAAQLLVDVQTAQMNGASGTVVEKSDLGLPALPGIGSRGGSTANLNSLTSGSHTLRVWYSGPDKARIALLGAMGESDIIQNGSNLWIWSSESNTAQHGTLPKKSDKPRPTPTGLPTTPQAAADLVLQALNPTTAVSVDPTGTVAGRPVYTLALAPKDTHSLIDRVTIAIDGTEHVPLQVQVFAKGYEPPAFKIGFTDVSFTRPDASRFAFTPPPGAKVSELSPLSMLGMQEKAMAERPKTAVIGKGWTSVLAIRVPEQASSGKGTSSGTESGALGAILGALRPVQGSWGSGRMLTGRLFSVLLTDDGRVLVGAVSGDQLLAAAADPAAALK